ncbi:MAG: hypothetical protein LBM77_05055 [Spirochaetaceae bacterium]|jgi:hypothetical protein|nr:hypothetical protein [Spirochaetaceae bacterium]
MTLTDVLAGTAILIFFLVGFSQTAFPAMKAWNAANVEYREARSLEFVANSFRAECAKEARNMKAWETAVSTVKEMTSYEIEEINHEDSAVAMRLRCTVGSSNYEILALCAGGIKR